MTPPPLLQCPCGAYAIPGSLWSPADSAAWEHEHATHGTPADHGVLVKSIPTRMSGILPVAEARELRRELRGVYAVGIVEHGAVASVCVKRRG